MASQSYAKYINGIIEGNHWTQNVVHACHHFYFQKKWISLLSRNNDLWFSFMPITISFDIYTMFVTYDQNNGNYDTSFDDY